MIIRTATRVNHLRLVNVQFGAGDFAKLNAFPGYSRWDGRELEIRSIGVNLRYLLDTWPGAEWEGEAEAIREEFIAQEEEGARTALAKNLDLPDLGDYTYHRDPMPHQHHGFLLSRGKPAFALLMEQGTGKTKIIIDTACHLYRKGEIEMMIVVAWPNGVHRNWVEYEMPLDMSVPYVAEYWSDNHKSKGKRVSIRKMMLAQGKLRVMTFNIEAFTSEHGRAVILELLQNNRCLLVIDQSASIKNPHAERTKFLIKQCSPLAPYRRIMDGSPVAEGAEELYCQFKFLDPNIIGHDSWTAFKAEYCKIGLFKQIEGYKNMDRLRSLIDGYCYRVLADDCQNLPPRVYKSWPFDLDAEEQRVFDEMKGEGLAFFRGDNNLISRSVIRSEDPEKWEDYETIEEHLAMVKNMRLQQISSGWWPAPDGIKPISKDKTPSRWTALNALLSDLKGKALIFARFRADLELLQTKLGAAAVSFHGGVKDYQRSINKRRFMEDPKVKYFLGQPRSAGLGHTLTAAKHVIFYSNDDSLRLREECEKRAHRQGQTSHLIIWDLMARGTHDRKLVNALRAKKKLSNLILKDPEGFFLEYDN